MEPTFHVQLRYGDRLGSGDNNLISGDVPDQVKRVGAKGKPNTNNADPDFSQPLQVVNPNPNPNPVDTGPESLSAQDERLLDIKKSYDLKPDTKANTPVDLMERIHQGREVLDEI
jgi:hypothetical protein